MKEKNPFQTQKERHSLVIEVSLRFNKNGVLRYSKSGKFSVNECSLFWAEMNKQKRKISNLVINPFFNLCINSFFRVCRKASLFTFLKFVMLVVDLFFLTRTIKILVYSTLFNFQNSVLQY